MVLERFVVTEVVKQGNVTQELHRMETDCNDVGSVAVISGESIK